MLPAGVHCQVWHWAAPSATICQYAMLLLPSPLCSFTHANPSPAPPPWCGPAQLLKPQQPMPNPMVWHQPPTPKHTNAAVPHQRMIKHLKGRGRRACVCVCRREGVRRRLWGVPACTPGLQPIHMHSAHHCLHCCTCTNRSPPVCAQQSQQCADGLLLAPGGGGLPAEKTPCLLLPLAPWPLLHATRSTHTTGYKQHAPCHVAGMPTLTQPGYYSQGQAGRMCCSGPLSASCQHPAHSVHQTVRAGEVAGVLL
jgi:hypothetical protein